MIDTEPGGPVPDGSALRARASRRAADTLGAWRSDGAARWVFIWPAVIVILFLSIFPLIASVALSLSKLAFNQGGVDLKFIGFTNYIQLLFGTEQSHFLGVLKTPTPLGWLILLVGVGGTVWAFTRTVRAGTHSPFGLALRLMAGIVFVGFLWLVVAALASNGGRPGALIVTFIFVFAGIGLQLALGLGLAMLCVQAVPWRRFFRVAFLIPLTITPVGVGYMFLMMTDTSQGPLEPIWVGLGLRDFSWVTDPWAARVAVIIGDTWQWTPFVFIVLLAALESLDQEVREAAVVDGATPPAELRPHHDAGDPAGRHDDRAHPADRGLQDHRHAQHPARRRAGHGHPIAVAPGVHRLEHVEPRAVGGDRLPPAHPGDARGDRLCEHRPTTRHGRRMTSAPMSGPGPARS